VLSRDYGSYSFREWRSGVIAYVIGFVTLLGTARFLFDTLRGVRPEDDVSRQFVSLKLGLTVTGAGAAAVAFGLGARFLHRANQNKRVELELRAIEPLLADINDADLVHRVKTEFIERSFGRAWETKGASQMDSINVSNFERLASAIAGLLKS
jgi:hypothetical protein